MMDYAINKAEETMKKGYGGPFGAVIVKDNKIISIASNTVLKDDDPTAHAEINAIREACKQLKTYNLKDCILYATGYPCPMCISAIMWSNIQKVYYGTDLKEAEKLGFKDDMIYQFIKQNNKEMLEMTQMDHEKCLELFHKYSQDNGIIY